RAHTPPPLALPFPSVVHNAPPARNVFAVVHTGYGVSANSRTLPANGGECLQYNCRMKDKIQKSEEEWKKELTPEQYQVCRMKGTERPFTGAYYKTKEPGVYKCAACGNELFDSDTKFDSGTGWPSFYKPIPAENVATEDDSSYGMVRTEVMS